MKDPLRRPGRAYPLPVNSRVGLQDGASRVHACVRVRPSMTVPTRLLPWVPASSSPSTRRSNFLGNGGRQHPYRAAALGTIADAIIITDFALEKV